MPLIAVTGGIGAGKSFVCNILRKRGYNVYDCDLEARRILEHDKEIQHRIASEIDSQSIINGKVDRARLASVVFSDKDKLNILNSIVHGRIRRDVARTTAYDRQNGLVFVETALLYSSGLYHEVDGEWRVEAPENIRIDRVCMRNNVSPQQVKSRIAAQTHDTDPEHPLDFVITIYNDGKEDLDSQIDAAVKLTVTSL